MLKSQTEFALPKCKKKMVKVKLFYIIGEAICFHSGQTSYPHNGL